MKPSIKPPVSDPSAPEEPEPIEIVALGKDEMNLAEFPIALLSDRVPHGKQIIQYQDQIFDEKSGRRITRKLTIKAPNEDEGQSGLPTAVDNDVILGLIQLTAGFSLIAGNTYGRVIGIIGAALGALESLLAVGGNYPFWSLGVFALCLWILYGLTVLGEEEVA